MNALILMKKDHRKVEDLFRRLIHTTDRAKKKRETLFKKLKTELDAHAQMEEKVFYPSLKEKDKEGIIHAYEEHKMVKDLLKELKAMPKDKEEWLIKLKLLEEQVSHHVKEEEEEIFKEAQQILSRQRLLELGDEMAEVKKKFLNDPLQKIAAGL